MKQYKSHTLKEYTQALAKKAPTPGGGSAAALTGSLGVGLLVMVARYSKGKGANKRIEKKIDATIADCEKKRKRLLELVDLDAKAYLKFSKTKKGTKARTQATVQVREIPLEVCRICYEGIDHAPFLVESGNKHLVADVAVACELLLSAFNGALTLAQYN